MGFSDLELAVRAKKSGMKVMMIIAYCPGWLAYNGTSKGVPIISMFMPILCVRYIAVITNI